MPTVDEFLRDADREFRFRPFTTLSGTLGAIYGPRNVVVAGLLIALRDGQTLAEVPFGTDSPEFLAKFGKHLDTIFGGPPHTVGPRNALVAGHLQKLEADRWQLVKVAFFVAADEHKAIVIRKKRKGYELELLRLD